MYDTGEERIMVAQPIAAMTEEEYLAFERASDARHEFLDGRVYAMAGASVDHGRIIQNTSSSLFNQLGDGPCEAITNDLRVRVSATQLNTYPDIVVVCGEPELTDDRQDTLLNPTVLIEVLSPSTEAYDRGAKWLHYQRIESLREYVLIAQDAPAIEHYVRQGDGSWRYEATIGLGSSVTLPSLGCALALAIVYRRVTFDRSDGVTDAAER
jgi:Uma2 family endonuclease